MPSVPEKGMLKLNNIEVTYLNVIRVLHGVSMSVEDGAIVALLGANGAGKSSTLKAISGLLHVEEGEVTDGSIEWDGQRIDTRSAEQIGKLGIVQALEGRRVFGHLTTEENLMVGAFNRTERAAIKQDLEMVYSYFPRLKDLRGNIAGYLSGGEQQMLVIGRAMMASPRLMMLDEPSLGLAPIIVEHTFNTLRELHRSGMAILLVEQNAFEALQLADRAYVLESGRLATEGSGTDLLNDKSIQNHYLGGET